MGSYEHQVPEKPIHYWTQMHHATKLPHIDRPVVRVSTEEVMCRYNDGWKHTREEKAVGAGGGIMESKDNLMHFIEIKNVAH